MDGVNIGKTGQFSSDRAVLAQRVGRLNSEQIEFVYQVVSDNKFIAAMNKISVGNAIKHISLQQISSYSFYAPIFDNEQAKIGVFLQVSDCMIALQQDKIKKLKKLKESYLQKVFV